MSVREEFDAWAAEGRDRGMEDRHWHTAEHALARMPVEAGDTVLDLGCGSGYAARALRDADDAGRAYSLDGAPEMIANARGYTDDPPGVVPRRQLWGAAVRRRQYRPRLLNESRRNPHVF